MKTASPVLCDTDPLIILGKLNRLELLRHEIAARPDIWMGAKLCEQVLASLRSSSD